MFVPKIGMRRVYYAVFCIAAIVLVACTQTAPSAPKISLSSDPVVRWIQQNALPLRTVNPGGSDSDLAALQQMVGHASIVGLGEETHGTHEFYDIKARLAEYLITKLGFTTFVMENNWGASQLIDAYINGGAGNIDDVMQAGLSISWQTQEYRALLEWMRAYNANPVNTTKLHFLGMDFQDISQNDFDAVENYLQRVDPRQAATVQQIYKPIIPVSSPNIFYVSLSASTKQQYQDQAQQVYNLLQAHQQEYIKQSSPQSFALALQNARIIVQFITHANANTSSELLARYYQRDTFMAENVAWIHDHDAGSNPKIIVWAHDAHIANDTLYNSPDGNNMGGDLRAHYKDGYLAIGTTLYQGAFRVFHFPQTSTQQIPKPDVNTYNYDLGQADLPLYMLDLRKIPSGSVMNWANSSTTTSIFLLYGLGGEDLSKVSVLNHWFDVIVHIQRTTPSNAL